METAKKDRNGHEIFQTPERLTEEQKEEIKKGVVKMKEDGWLLYDIVLCMMSSFQERYGHSMGTQNQFPFIESIIYATRVFGGAQAPDGGFLN